MNKPLIQARKILKEIEKSKQEIENGKGLTYTLDELLASFNKKKKLRILKRKL